MSDLSLRTPAVAGSSAAMPPSKIKVLAWMCRTCDKSCYPVGESSQCHCGHRLRDHVTHPGLELDKMRCTRKNCTCQAFRYHVSSGAWSVRCACKHKHTEHSAVPPFGCEKPRCSHGCQEFRSTWVCNCDCPWSHHETRAIEKSVSAGLMHLMGGVQTMADVNRGEGK